MFRVHMRTGSQGDYSSKRRDRPSTEFHEKIEVRYKRRTFCESVFLVQKEVRYIGETDAVCMLWTGFKPRREKGRLEWPIERYRFEEVDKVESESGLH